MARIMLLLSLVMCTASDVNGQQFRDSVGVVESEFGILVRPEVQQILRMSPEQQQLFNDCRSFLLGEYRAAREQLERTPLAVLDGLKPPLTSSDKGAIMRAESNRMSCKLDILAQSVLTDEQVDKLNQLVRLPLLERMSFLTQRPLVPPQGADQELATKVSDEQIAEVLRRVDMRYEQELQLRAEIELKLKKLRDESRAYILEPLTDKQRDAMRPNLNN